MPARAPVEQGEVAGGWDSEAERLRVEAARKDPAQFGVLYETHFEVVYAYLARRIVPHDLREAVRDLPVAELRRLGALDRGTIGVFRFSGAGPWERHPDGDELVVVLEGGGEITVLADDRAEPVRAELRPGRLFVCPRGLWHRPVATPSMTALYVTPLAGSEHSWADDPRL